MGTFTTPRRKDWTIRWVEFIKDCQDIASDLQLNWEDITCTSWMGMAVEVLTGEDPYEPYRGTHDGPIGAAKAIKKAGFSNLDDLIADLWEEIPIGMAQTGDVVLVKVSDYTDDEELRMVMPHGVAVADPPFFWSVNEEGLAKGDLYAHGLRAFAVGREG